MCSVIPQNQCDILLEGIAMRIGAVASLVALICLACSSGGSDGGNGSAGETPDAPQRAAYRPDLSGVCCAGLRITISNIELDSTRLSAQVTVENSGEFGNVALDFRERKALFFSEPDAARWREAFPEAFAANTIKELLTKVSFSSIALTLAGGSDSLPMSLAPNERWTAVLESNTPPPADASALLFVLDEARLDRPYRGSTNLLIGSFDETHPYIGLTEPVTVAPVPTVAPLSVSVDDRIRIPKIGIDAPLALKIVGQDGNMPNPDDGSVSLYDFALFGPAYGGTPNAGNAVLAAFVQRQTGPGLFFDLLKLAAGDEVELVHQGRALKYTVVNKCAVPNADFEAAIVKTSSASLTLLRSGGGPVAHIVRAEAQTGSLARGCPAGTEFSGDQPPPPPPPPTPAPGSLHIEFIDRLAPGAGENRGPLANYVSYRFRIAGFDQYTFDPQSPQAARITVTPALPQGQPGFNRSQGIIEYGFPPGAPAGRYQFTIRTPDGQEVSVSFDHTP
jgi:hypothetical protein